jgi:two-component system chemotaxis response regulator CheB
MSSQRPIRVVLVDDSSLARVVLRAFLEADGDIRVVAEAADGLEAPEIIRVVRPDIVTMDIDMPGRSGLETITAVMRDCPVPILVVSSEQLDRGSDVGSQAIDRGALDFVPKPSVIDEQSGVMLREHVRRLTGVPAVSDATKSSVAATVVPGPSGRQGIDLVAIAAGLGGSQAVKTVLARLPKDFPATVAIAQHRPRGQGQAYAAFLRETSRLRVTIVAPASEVHCGPGEVLVPANDLDLVCVRRGIFEARAARRGGVIPSADVLFDSAAGRYGGRAAAVVLSGPGMDGADGLATMRAAGARTIAESSTDATLGEMPRAARQAGAVERSMPAELIADYLVALCTPNALAITRPPTKA